MKTKIKYFIFIFILSFFNLTNVNALTPSDWLEKLTSWLKYTYYEVKWCSPHAWKLSDTRFNTARCQKWKFQKIWNIWKMTYKWENFANWNVVLNNDIPSTTRTASQNLINFFDWIDSVEFEWEWTYTVKILLVDYAYNASHFEFTYKIDKTAPQFKITWMSEKSNNIYVHTNPKVVWINWNVVKYDSTNNISSWDEYILPSPILNNYTWEIPQNRSWHQRQDLYTVYFKDFSDTFNLTSLFSDSYNWNLKSYISWENTRFDLLDETWNKKPITDLSKISISDFVGHWENSQKKYKIRAYDNTVWRWWNKTPNYSEVIFYAVRDNTRPNMISGDTDSKIWIQKLLKFDDNTTTVWDNNATTNNVWKFIRANTHTLKSELKDIWIWAWTNYAYYNAWIPLWWWTKIQIEKSDVFDQYSDVFDQYNNRFVNELSKDNKFENVDNDRTNWYRKYTTKFLTNWITWDNKICDNVWNCLLPKLDFRVVANTLSVYKSDLNLSLETWKKVFANWKDKYIVQTQLKDNFWNAIVWVKAIENSNKVIKKANITFNFNNWLYYDQLKLTWGKWVEATDLLLAKNDKSYTSTINTNNKVYFEEKEENWTIDNLWTYKFDIRSKVPSVWAYPYLSDAWTLKLNNVNPKAIAWNTALVWFYPSDEKLALWLFDTTKDLNWENNLISSNTSFMSNSSPSEDLNAWQKDNYWRIVFNTENTKYNEFDTKKLEFDFASPFAYGWKDFSLSKLVASTMAEDKHDKIFYKLSDLSNVRLKEFFLPAYNSTKFTPWYFWVFRNDIDISSWATYNVNSDFDNSIEFKVKTKPLKNQYDVWKPYNMWYVSYLTYEIDWKDITIPSISRNVKNNIKTTDKKLSSYYYFPLKSENWYEVWWWDYVIVWDSVLNSWLASALWIAITWLTNANSKLITWDTWWKANVNIATDFTKFDLWSTLKKNIYNYAKSITWFTWDEEINETELNNWTTTWTYDIKWEKVTFIDWNLEINCWAICKLDDNLKRTIIVRNGSVYIKSNITTYWKNSQLAIISLNSNWLEQFIFPTDWKLDYKSVKWWIFIDPSITNIDASLVSQWPTVSYQDDKLFYKNIDWASLKNQLHIYWWLISLNTIWWSKADSPKCPYIIQNCDQDKARVFDLAIFRRYWLVSWNLYWQDINKLFPMHSANDSTNIYAFRSWKNNSWLDYITTASGITIPKEADTSWIDWKLRWISDKDYIVYPVVVERDPKWWKNPSIFFQIK